MTWPENLTKEALASPWGLRHSLCHHSHCTSVCWAILILKIAFQNDPLLAFSFSLILTDHSLKQWLGQKKKSPSFDFQSNLQLTKRRVWLIITKPKKPLAISGNGFFHLHSISSKYSENWQGNREESLLRTQGGCSSSCWLPLSHKGQHRKQSIKP